MFPAFENIDFTDFLCFLLGGEGSHRFLTELLLELYVVSDGAFAARTVRQALQHGTDLPLGGFDLGMERAGGDAQRPVAEDDDLLGAVGCRHAHAAFAAQLVGRALDVGAGSVLPGMSIDPVSF